MKVKNKTDKTHSYISKERIDEIKEVYKVLEIEHQYLSTEPFYFRETSILQNEGINYSVSSSSN